MGERRSTRAFVLRTVDYGDRDIVATLFAETDGELSAIAKNARGSKRRFGGGIEPMRLLRVELDIRAQSDLDRLDELEVIDDHPNIRESFDKITVGSYATDLLRAVLVEADPSPQLFELAVRFYERLEEAEPLPDVLEVLISHFELEVLELAGVGPGLETCLRCDRPMEATSKQYALRSGAGLVCPDCIRTGEPSGVLFPGTLDVLRYLRNLGASAPEAMTRPKCLDQARRFIRAAVECVVEKPLKSRSMLASVLPDRSDSNEH